MIREVSIVPTITVDNKKDYREQVERINVFTRRVQIDITDGIFASSETLDITNIWWPKNWEADLHLMVAQPSQYIDKVVKMAPSLCIFHAETNETNMTASPDGFESIQELIYNSQTGDSIQLENKTYVTDGSAIFIDKNLTIYGSKSS